MTTVEIDRTYPDPPAVIFRALDQIVRSRVSEPELLSFDPTSRRIAFAALGTRVSAVVTQRSSGTRVFLSAGDVAHQGMARAALSEILDLIPDVLAGARLPQYRRAVATASAAAVPVKVGVFARLAAAWGPPVNPVLVCAHCQTRGYVTAQQVRVKRGVSGGKATGAVLTGGLSMLATGLSRMENVTRFRCRNCGVTWTA